MPTRCDAVVIGAGVIGLSVAWRAARRGMKVLVVDDDESGGATSASAGMLAPVTEVHYGEERLLEIALASARAYPRFVAELEETSGIGTGYRACGTLVVARDTDDNAVLDDLFRYQRRLGLEVTRLRSAECRDLEPALVPSVRGGLLVEGDHQIDPRALTTSLARACERAGVERYKGRASEIVVTGGRVAGIRVAEGSAVDSDVVVIAAGCWSGSIGGISEPVRLPVRPVKGQAVYLADPHGAPLIERNVRGLDVYLVARGDGRIVVGATVEEQAFDTTVTAGAVLELLRDAYEIVPGIAELEMTEVVVGLRPGTPDNAPILGETAVAGLIAATGHYRSGILLAPITGDAVSALISSGDTPDAIEPFSPARFEEVRTDA